MKRYIFHHSQHPTNRSEIFQVYVNGMRFLFNKTKLPQLLFTCDLSTPPPPFFLQDKWRSTKLLLSWFK